MRFNRGELDVIKALFKDNDFLLKTLRKFFFQGVMTKEEQDALDRFKENALAMKILRKTLIPEIDPDSPFNQYADVFIGISTKDRSSEYVAMEVNAMAGLQDYLTKRFNKLEDKNAESYPLRYYIDFGGRTNEEMHLLLATRNALLYHIDMHIQELGILAEIKDETFEQEMERKLKDSAK